MNYLLATLAGAIQGLTESLPISSTGHLIIFAAKYLYLLVILIAVFSAVINKKTFVQKSILKLAIIALPLSFIISRILSLFIYTNRPFVVEGIKPLISHAANNGFPSDHTLLVMTIAAIFLIYNYKSGIVLTLLSFTVGYARILAKIHSPVDVLGSIAIAVIAVLVSWAILKRTKSINLFLDKILSRTKI